MKLLKLDIAINSELIRSVPFKDGLNLITNKRGVGRSGNSVGKSTLSRVIDYLFLASVDLIYIDEEFKRANERIEYLLANNNVEATLSFLGVDERAHQMSRNLAIPSKDERFYFDGVLVDYSVYQKKILEFVFDIRTERPSVRVLVPKFIRNNSHRMLNTTKFLERFAGSKDYGEVFLYLMGFGNTALLTEKRVATNLASRRKRNSQIVNALVKEQKPGADIEKLKHKISVLEKDFLNFNYSSAVENPLQTLSDLQSREDAVSMNLLAVDRRIDNIKKTVEILEAEGGNYLINELDAIYKYAKVSINSVIRDFESVLSFHDNLVAKKKQFITVDLPALEAEHSSCVARLNELHEQKLRVFSDLRSAESVNRITANLKELGELRVSLGKLQGLLEQQIIASRELELAEEALEKILAKIIREIELVNKFEDELNRFFGSITKKTHAELYKFHLNFNHNSGTCDIDIENPSSNPEGGKKKAEVIAFDLAYIKAVDYANLRRPKFVFHDGIEDIDQKQIGAIFDIARKIPGQQIVSMLSDKLTSEMYDSYSSDCVLFLSEDDMFFKIN